MKIPMKAVALAAVLLLSAATGFSADVKVSATPAPSVKEVAKEKSADVKGAVKGKVIDINSAAEAELKSIAGIGDAYAAKIVAGRPYANKTQLKSRKILPDALYEQVKDQLIARQAKK